MNKKRFQADFFAEMAEPQAFRTIFEHLPDVYFFVKDRKSRIITASSTILERLGLKTELEFVGALDEEFFPPNVAKSYRDDDARVYRTGKPLVNRLEVWFDESRNLDWCLTTKVPLRGKNGKIIGLMGITRRDAGRAAHQPSREAQQVVNHLQQHADRIISTAELAGECGMSERTLYRRINESLGVTPYELMLRIRVQKAAEALIRTTAKIVDVAHDHGFCDQSTFTQHFRKRTGMTPKQFRTRYQG